MIISEKPPKSYHGYAIPPEDYSNESKVDTHSALSQIPDFVDDMSTLEDTTEKMKEQTLRVAYYERAKIRLTQVLTFVLKEMSPESRQRLLIDWQLPSQQSGADENSTIMINLAENSQANGYIQDMYIIQSIADPDNETTRFVMIDADSLELIITPEKKYRYLAIYQLITEIIQTL